MDAFFASVEQLDDPSLRGKPVAVGGGGPRGVVGAASYEARKYGVRSAMPGSRAKQLCPALIFVRGNYERYKEVSMQIREIFSRYTDLIEPLSLDEAYLDVTENKIGHESAIYIAQQIRKDIKQELNLNASAGVSINKFIAKIASDINKPNGLKTILPEEVPDFLEKLPIRKFFGVGEATAAKLTKDDIHFGKDVKSYDKFDLVERYGKLGKYLFNMAWGLDDRPVRPNRIRKSYSKERTYGENLTDLEEIKNKLGIMSREVYESSSARGIMGKTVNIKIRLGDFSTFTRSKTFNSYVENADLMEKTALNLLDELDFHEKGIRLIGAGLAKLNTELSDNQLTLDF